MTALALVAPLVLPLDPSRTSYEGYITLNDSNTQNSTSSELWWIKLTNVPASGRGSLSQATLQVGDELAEFITGYEEIIIARLKDSVSLEAFFVELKTILSHIASQTPLINASRPATFYSTLRRELEAIGWSRITHIADDLSTVKVSSEDAAGRRHILTIKLASDYPVSRPVVVVDLPATFQPRWAPAVHDGITSKNSNSTLLDIVQQFEDVLTTYQRVWNDLEELDLRAWVIEPLNAPKAVVYRRIALGEHVTLGVTVNPLEPGAFPECRFMGPDRAVVPMRNKLLSTSTFGGAAGGGGANNNNTVWDPELSLYTNLERCLGFPLPSKSLVSSVAAEDMAVECAICYAYRLPTTAGNDGKNELVGGGLEQQQQMDVDQEQQQGDVPDVNCDNATCSKPFHRKCIVEWLAADPTTRQSFGTLFGVCPYCSQALNVKES